MDKINKITTSKQTTMYDHLCKMIIGNEEVLSRIIKVVVDEAKHLSIEEIRRLIKGVHIGDRIVNPHFHLVDKEGFIKDEGMVYYDILCYIDVPQKDGKKIKIIFIQDTQLLREGKLILPECYLVNGEESMMVKTMME